jgi:hypothetical protein
MSCTDFWDPAFAALSCILDALPKEQQDRAIEQLKLMAVVQADRGNRTADYFCRALAGEEFPAPKARPKLTIIK